MDMPQQKFSKSRKGTPVTSSIGGECCLRCSCISNVNSEGILLNLHNFHLSRRFLKDFTVLRQTIRSNCPQGKLSSACSPASVVIPPYCCSEETQCQWYGCQVRRNNQRPLLSVISGDSVRPSGRCVLHIQPDNVERRAFAKLMLQYVQSMVFHFEIRKLHTCQCCAA